MARVMFARHVAMPADDPVFLAQGSSGTTPFPVPVETGGCYLAVVALTHGHARSLQIRTVVGARESTDERGAAEEAALSAFCVNAHETRARRGARARHRRGLGPRGLPREERRVGGGTMRLAGSRRRRRARSRSRLAACAAHPAPVPPPAAPAPLGAPHVIVGALQAAPLLGGPPRARVAARRRPARDRRVRADERG